MRTGPHQCQAVGDPSGASRGGKVKASRSMPNEALPNKREVMLALLAETSVFVHLDPRSPAVRVPPWFKNQPQLVLQIGLNMAVPIPDLDVNERGIDCTLSFSRRPFPCSIPWAAVFGLVGDNGPGLVWPDDVPAEVAAQVQAQTNAQKAQPPGKKAPVREAPRGRLRAIGSSEPTAEHSATSPAQEVAVAAPSTPPAPVAAEPAEAAQDNRQETGADQQTPEAKKPQTARKPGQAGKAGSKRELPPYLRVVK